MKRTSFERFLDVLWKHEIKTINAHLPKIRKPLSELINESEPAVPTQDGNNFFINKDELVELANLLPKRMHKYVRLPIILIRRVNLGPGVFTVGGSKWDAEAIRIILDLENSKTFPLYLYRPQVYQLRKKFRTLTVIGFSISEL
ncbi:MAG: DUF61 family protein [Candidatus Odinarchaeia archaeon]